MNDDLKKIKEIDAESIATWLESNKNKLPNVEKLIVKLRRNKGHEGHTVHGKLIKNIVESGSFTITDIENNADGFDIDVQLDNSINIQVQYGASVAWYNSERGFVSELGGVKTDWDKDEQKIFSKLKQLPNTGLGILFQFAYGTGSHILPEWKDNLPDNKVIVLAHMETDGKKTYGVADIFCSENFQDIDKVQKIVDAIGFTVRGVF